MKELLEAGVHFGHQTKALESKDEGIHLGERNGIYIIDLQTDAQAVQGSVEVRHGAVRQRQNDSFVWPPSSGA